MRIATGGISHETSTFVPTPTTLRDFETGLGLFRGSDLLTRFRGTNNCTGGFITGADRVVIGCFPMQEGRFVQCSRCGCEDRVYLWILAEEH